MRLFLITGKEHTFTLNCLQTRKATVTNAKNPLTLDGVFEYLDEPHADFDKIIITDGGLCADVSASVRHIGKLKERGVPIAVITRDFLLDAELPGVAVAVSSFFRYTEKEISAVLSETSKDTPRRRSPKPPKEDRAAKPEKPPKRFGVFGKKPPKEQEEETSGELGNLRLTSSRAVIFTGNRGSGVTSTAVNAARSASLKGLRVMLLDFDIDFRMLNLYFGKFLDETEEEEVSASLVRLLAQPHSYQTSSVNIDGDFWVSSLGYGFNDEALLNKHLTEPKIIGLITYLKQNFDMVAMDFPMDALARFPALINNADVISLCMENNMYSAFTTIRHIAIRFGADISYFISKSRLTVTKYNDESVYDEEVITPEGLSELIVNEGFCDDITYEIPVSGKIPYSKWFDRQIERDLPISETDSQMRQAYDEILLRLLGALR
ncbi:hypothetical protein AGMMS49975_02360 [Clostridia bacterium]|nr:hypothetical protein AGMMS49975_02360 [Clostridia bacterium]